MLLCTTACFNWTRRSNTPYSLFSIILSTYLTQRHVFIIVHANSRLIQGRKNHANNQRLPSLYYHVFALSTIFNFRKYKIKWLNIIQTLRSDFINGKKGISTASPSRARKCIWFPWEVSYWAIDGSTLYPTPPLSSNPCLCLTIKLPPPPLPPNACLDLMFPSLYLKMLSLYP